MMSSLYIGATGLKSHGEGMGVITNNLANVNTVGYKQTSMQYADLMNQYMTTGAGNLTNTSQTGMGSAAGSIRTLFEQGGVETGSASTDLYIKGGGFFGVTRDGQTHYTRAGNFRFDKNGALLDANGWNVLGRPLDGGNASAGPQAIMLDMSANGAGTMAARATSRISIASNLGGLENTNNAEDNAFFSMAADWNGSGSPPLSESAYSYSEPVQFYDSNGELRSATIYYDLAGSSEGYKAVEYLLALDPAQDGSALSGTRAAGLLMAGTITFASDGSMVGMTAFTPPASGDPSDLSGWTPASVQDGKPVFAMQADGAQPQSVAFDMGYTYTADGGSGAGTASAAEMAATPGVVYQNFPGGRAEGQSFSSVGETNSSLYTSQNGYPEGSLRDVTVSENGIVSGIYSNGQSDDLYQVSLFRFTSQDGLRHEGHSHYSATPESGAAEEGLPGTENFGTLAGNSLEQSNVDYAREFSLLIVTQRGFQMNSKVVTTSDTMLQKALELKR